MKEELKEPLVNSEKKEYFLKKIGVSSQRIPKKEAVISYSLKKVEFSEITNLIITESLDSKRNISFYMAMDKECCKEFGYLMSSYIDK